MTFSLGRTTLIIAHRLSTIRNADKIIVMQKGEVIEEGDHDTLMKNESVYFDLVRQQNAHDAEEEEEFELEKEEAKKILLSEQVNDDYSEQHRRRGSTIINVTMSALNELYDQKQSTEINDNTENETKEETKVIKNYKKKDFSSFFL